eukprot:7535431-Pyramimonas_sp.AAC.1
MRLPVASQYRAVLRKHPLLIPPARAPSWPCASDLVQGRDVAQDPSEREYWCLECSCKGSHCRSSGLTSVSRLPRRSLLLTLSR